MSSYILWVNGICVYSGDNERRKNEIITFWKKEGYEDIQVEVCKEKQDTPDNDLIEEVNWVNSNT
tara:strand:+ start:248 stop:442 length:195 start_codon:yes stop_codon:yes gene_type:complete